MKPKNINCKTCGQPFVARDPRKMYCSAKCNRAAQYAKEDHSKRDRLKVTKCKQCGKEFKPYSSRNKYCSERCKTTWTNANRSYKHTCKGCGVEFASRQIKQDYCTIACAVVYTVPTKTLTCVDCGKVFEFKGRTTKHRCTACSHKYWKKYLRAYNSEYDGPYRQILRSKPIKTRFAFRKLCYTRWPKACACCGIAAVERKGYIDVHHIDGDPSNDDINNLVPLCRRCHKRVHKKNGKTLQDNLFELWPEGQQVIGIPAERSAGKHTANSGNAKP